MSRFSQYDLQADLERDSASRVCGPRSQVEHGMPELPLCVDLFSGAGGFSLGAIQAGFDVCAAVEHCRHAVATYCKQIRNFSNRKVVVFESDILELDPHELMDESGLLEGA